MSKYIKLEDAISLFGRSGEYHADAIVDMLFFLPTIEVSEDCVSRKWLEENAKEFGDYYENTVWAVPLSVLTDAPSVVPSCQKNRQVGRAEGEWIIHKINGIPHTVECSRCHQHYDYEELRLLGRSKGCIDIPHCPNCGAHLKGEGN